MLCYDVRDDMCINNSELIKQPHNAFPRVESPAICVARTAVELPAGGRTMSADKHVIRSDLYLDVPVIININAIREDSRRVKPMQHQQLDHA